MSDNPYQYTEPDANESSNRNELVDDDFEADGDYSKFPFPLTPFTIDMVKKRWFSPRKKYQLIFENDHLTIIGDDLEEPANISRSKAGKMLFWKNKDLRVEFSRKNVLLLKSARHENIPIKYAMLVCWVQMIEEREKFNKRMREVMAVFTLNFLIAFFAIPIVLMIIALIRIWLDPWAPIAVKILAPIVPAIIIALMFATGKYVWPLFVLFLLSATALILGYHLFYSAPAILCVVCSVSMFFAYLCLISFFKMLRNVKLLNQLLANWNLNQ